ncbi:Protein of unknown function (DUF974) domain containing protein, partial [Russula decolorans]
TVRPVTNASALLTLPSSFGTIQLGETFSGILAVNNESAAMVDCVNLHVEMQTAASKVLLADIGGPTLSLVAGDTRLPPGTRKPAASAATTTLGGVDTGDDNGLQNFRKFYKFAVTNPLSVKTKVHVPRSPSALPSTEERSKVFLEVHIQNLTSDPMWFERIILEPAPGWNIQNINLLPDSQKLSLTVQHVQLSTAPTTSEAVPPATTSHNSDDTRGDECSRCVDSGHGHGIIPYATIIVDAP